MLGGFWELLTRRGIESQVSWKWLLRPSSLVNARFAKRARVEVTEDGPDLLVRIDGEPFVWPKESPVSDLLTVAAELALPQHPHQYLWGQTQIRPGDIVLDIGSCEGSFAALAVKKQATVVAVEPSQRMQRIIRRLFEQRNLPPPRIAGCALAAVKGTTKLVEDPDHPGYAYLSDTAQGGEVQVLSLDELVEQLRLPRVDFIKCDAEGSDVDIIKSGEKTLRRDRPRLAVCTYHADDHFVQLAEYLQGLGYRVEGKGFMHTVTKHRPDDRSPHPPGQSEPPGRTVAKYRVLMLHAW